MIAPLTEKPCQEYESRLKFCKLNEDENPKMAEKYRVMSIPLLGFSKMARRLTKALGESRSAFSGPKSRGWQRRGSYGEAKVTNMANF
jgi:hypothetical protein